MFEPGRCSSAFRSGPRHNCRGAVAVEFALVFVIFFSLFYAIVAYGFVFTIKQSLAHAAAEGARAAVQDAPTETTRLGRAQTTADGILSWLPAAGVSVNTSVADCAANPATRCITVAVNYNYGAHPIVPALPLLGIAIPANLGTTATVQL